MSKDSIQTHLGLFNSLNTAWAESHSKELSSDLINENPQLIHDMLIDDIERLKLMSETAEKAIKYIRYHNLAVRQGEGYQDEVEALWREHAVDNPPISDAMWDYIKLRLEDAGLPLNDWEDLEWLRGDAAGWIRDLAVATRGTCPTLYCFMRCKPNQVREILSKHGIWSRGHQVHSVEDDLNRILGD